jgi:membrane fusion protein (multidrug efflux system)
VSPDQSAPPGQPLAPDDAALKPLPPPVAARVPRRRRRPFLLPLLAVAGLAAIGGGTLWWLEARQYESTDDAFIDAHMVRVAPQVAGRVALVAVDDNQAVVPGQLLVKLDPAPLRPMRTRRAPRSALPKPMRRTR